MFRLYLPGAMGSLQIPRVYLSVISIFSTSSWIGPANFPSPVARLGALRRSLQLHAHVGPDHRHVSGRHLGDVFCLYIEEQRIDVVFAGLQSVQLGTAVSFAIDEKLAVLIKLVVDFRAVIVPGFWRNDVSGWQRNAVFGDGDADRVFRDLTALALVTLNSLY